MSSGLSRRLTRILDAVFLIGLPVAIGFVLVQPVRDPDTYFHILAGRHLLETGAFVGGETFSRYATQPWVLHEWLGQLPYAAAFELFGYPGVAWLSGVLALAFFLTMYFACRLQSRTIVALGTAFVAFAAAAGSLSPRPQVLSFVLLALTVGAWQHTAVTGRAHWWLVPLGWLWACSHGFWFLGPVVGLSVIAGLVLDCRRLERLHGQLLAIPAAQLIVAVMTPLGWEIYQVGVGMTAYTAHVAEWQSPELLDFSVVLVLALAAVVISAWATRRLAFSWVDVVLVGGGVVSTLATARTIAVGAVLIAPVAAKALQAMAPRPSSTSWRQDVGLLAVGALVGSLVLAAAVPRAASRPADVPLGLNDRLAALSEGTAIINEYALGGWVLLEFPNLEPVVDGRADVYPIDWFSAYVGAYNGEATWRQYVSRSGAEWALLKGDNALRGLLEEELGWCVVASDGGFDLLSAPVLCKSVTHNSMQLAERPIPANAE